MLTSKCSESIIPVPTAFSLSWEDMQKNEGVYECSEYPGECNFIVLHNVQGGSVVDTSVLHYYPANGKLSVASESWRSNRFRKTNATVCFELRGL